jgi:hypothetical protein
VGRLFVASGINLFDSFDDLIIGVLVEAPKEFFLMPPYGEVPDVKNNSKQNRRK